MGRRKKEPESVHREAITQAAERLFSRQGTDMVTVDEIAKEAGYSKATLYVYFRNKEEIVNALILKSMGMLHHLIHDAVSGPGDTKAKYDGICRALVSCQEQFPFYFELALGKINADCQEEEGTLVEKEIMETGERINEDLVRFLEEGMETGSLRAGLNALPTVFVFWAGLSGLILMSDKKRSYIGQAMELTRAQFLEYGFETLYRSVRDRGGDYE